MINVHATESGSVKGIIIPLRLFVILSKETQQAAVTIIIITIIVMFRAFFDIYSREKKEEEERITGNMKERPLSSSHPRSRQVSF